MTFKKFKKIWDKVAKKYPCINGDKSHLKGVPADQIIIDYGTPKANKVLAAYGRGEKWAKDEFKRIEKELAAAKKLDELENVKGQRLPGIEGNECTPKEAGEYFKKRFKELGT